MMENNQESSIKSDTIEKSNALCHVKQIENDQNDLFECDGENYNFGAEITETIITPKQIVDVDKANDEIKTNIIESEISTKTEQVLARKFCSSNNDDEDLGEEAEDEEEPCSEGNRSSLQFMQNQQNSLEVGSDVSSDDDSSTSTDSDFSDLSGMSEVSGKEWKPATRKPILWVQKQIHSGRNPRELLSRFLPAGAQSIALGLNDMSLWRLLANMLSEPPRRQKLRHVNTFDDVIQLIMKSENIVILTGAGVSVSCGIPDFRSSDGIYSRLAKDYPNLPDPQAMFDIDYFSRDPRPFFKFAREIYPGQFKPSPCHRFIKLLEDKQRLLRNYTQNIDTLEQVAGIKRVIECHGSFSTASCTKCKYKCDADAIRADIFAQRIPACPMCQPHKQQSVDAAEPVSEYDLRLLVANGIMKPDIVFFGEGLPEEFHKVMASDKDKCDLLIVIGSSLKVRPVALIPSSLPASVPQILINREQLNHLEFDVELLGDSDVIINQICHRLGEDWKQICFDNQVLSESHELRPFEEDCQDSEETENDDDAAQLQDTDTQSIQSNLSIDMVLRSAGACSDSGFESSTSLGQAESIIIPNISGSTSNIEIEHIKNSILEFNDDPGLTPITTPTTASDNSDFKPFSVRLDQEVQMTPPSVRGDCLRHLSVDSTKDSGIQWDSSNSTVTTTNTVIESDGTIVTQFHEAASCSSANLVVSPTSSADIKTQAKTSSLDSKKRLRSKSCSAAEFLIDGTYYYHKNSCSYVFPGAQISCYADSDSDLDDDSDDIETSECQNDEGNGENGNDFETRIPTNCLETSRENITSSRTPNCHKRRSSDDPPDGLQVEVLQVFDDCSTNVTTTDIACEETPPTKKRRNSENSNNEIQTPATTILTTTINTNAADCLDESGKHRNYNESTNMKSFEAIDSTTTLSLSATTTTMAPSLTTRVEDLQEI